MAILSFFFGMFVYLHCMICSVSSPLSIMLCTCMLFPQRPEPGSPLLNSYFERLARKYPRLYVMWIGRLIPAVQCVHPETIKVIFKSSEPKMTNSISVYYMALPWLGKITENKHITHSVNYVGPNGNFLYAI